MSAKNVIEMSHLTWPEYERRLRDGSLIVLPIGATEQHGIHLPLGTDWLTVTEMCRRIASKIGGIVAPPLAYGYRSHPRTGGGDAFPGTVNLSGSTLMTLTQEVLLEFVRHGARRILVVNGHFENEWFVREASYLAAKDAVAAGKDVRILMLSWWEPEDPAYVRSLYPSDEPLRPELQHAAWIETSLGLHLYPELVKVDSKPPDEHAQFPPYDVFPARREWVPGTGSLSPMSAATADAGAKLTAHYVERIAAAARTEFGL